MYIHTHTLTRHLFLVWVDRQSSSALELTSTTSPSISLLRWRNRPACTGTPNRLWILPLRTVDNKNIRTSGPKSTKCESNWSLSKSSGKRFSTRPCSNSHTLCTPKWRTHNLINVCVYLKITRNRRRTHSCHCRKCFCEIIKIAM